MRRSPAVLHSRLVLIKVGGWLVPLTLGLLIGVSTVMPTMTVALIAIALGLLLLGFSRSEPIVVLAFATMCMPALQVPGAPLPVNEVLMLVAVAIAALHPRSRLSVAPKWLVAGLGLLLGLLAFSTLVNGLFTFASTKRLVHLLVYVLVAVGLVRGRIPTRPACIGLVIGLVTSALSGMLSDFAGIGPDHYVGRLTGLFSDPNVAGLLITVLGPIAVMSLRERRWRRVLAVLLLIALVLTFSRTSFLAAGVVGLWLLVGRRLRPAWGFGLLALLILGIGFLPVSVQSIGPFEKRTGSDQLRSRIMTQELTNVGRAPVFGHGASTAKVLVNNDTANFFFHNSYLAMAQEGGYLTLGVFVVLLVSTFFMLVALSRGDRNPWLEASILALATCGMNLGEVLLELAGAVAIGFAIRHLVLTRNQGPLDRREAVPT